jgi:RNA-directed DNA polymerase
MRRAGNLFERIADLENLLVAFHAAAKGKANRPEVVAFRRSLHDRVLDIRNRLLGGEFEFGGYHEFTIRDPKTRTIQAAPFEQRVVHHAIVQVTGPVLERSLVFHSYACRKGKGQHAAARAAQGFCRRHPFYLKMDMEKFYDSIPHDRLMGLLERRFRERRLLGLFGSLLDSHCIRPEHGLPIGNLTSQYLGNLYLDRFDHWLVEAQGTPGHVRYMDDVVVWGGQEFLVGLARRAREWLWQELGLEVKHDGEVNRCSRGLPFVGWVVYPDRLRLGKGARSRFGRKLRQLERSFRRGRIGERELQVRGTALCAAVEQGNTAALRAAVAGRGIVWPGHA